MGSGTALLIAWCMCVVESCHSAEYQMRTHKSPFLVVVASMVASIGCVMSVVGEGDAGIVCVSQTATNPISLLCPFPRSLYSTIFRCIGGAAFCELTSVDGCVTQLTAGQRWI